MSFLTALATWALKNKVIAGGFALIMSKIYFFFDEWARKKFFPKPAHLNIESPQVTSEERKAVLKKKKGAEAQYVSLAWLLFFSILLLLAGYAVLTFYSLQFYETDILKLEAISELKLTIILCLAFFLGKLMSFNSTLEQITKFLPIIKSFIKK